jgi:hypothetical protein
MPSGLIDEEDGVGSWCDRLGDFREVQVHRFDIAGGQDQSRALALFRADGTEDIGRCGSLIPREVRPTSRAKPAAKRERRRPDPLLAVTAELEEWYQAEPWRTSREFLERVQAKYPGRYADGLIRTVQRRIKIWRGARARELMFGPFADAERLTADAQTQP